MRSKPTQRPSRRCPKCLGDMYPLELEHVRVDMCRRCMGIWFDARELSRAAGLKFDDGVSGTALVGSKRTGSRCPACAVPLYEREMDKGSGILVDQCPQCTGIFLDRDEFSRVRQHYASHGAARIERRPFVPRASGADDEGTYVDPDGSAIAVLQYLTGLPLELDKPQALFPPVVTTLIVLNVAAFVWAAVTGLQQVVLAYGLVPAAVGRGHHLETLLTSMFLHGGIFHLLVNMYFLYITGDNVEERLGWWRFIPFYFGCGMVAALAQIESDPASVVPMVGASGAISGVIGAYAVFWPDTSFRMRLLIGRWFVCRPVAFDIPAWAYVGLWAFLQLIMGAVGAQGVGWWAHLGGLACGVVVALLVRWRAGDLGRQAAPVIVRRRSGRSDR